jgi:hypothetical protein
MSYGKRQAISPKENMNKKGTGQCHEADPDTILKIELETINGKPFFGQATDDELLYIWCTVFGRKKDELFGVISTKSLTRNVRATYKLKLPLNLSELSASGSFSYEKYLDGGESEVITGRILNFGARKPVEIGECTKITVKTNYGVEASGVIAWLKNFGTIVGNQGFVENKHTGLKTDVFETEIVLKKHVYEYLPMFGQKTVVYYPGIPRMCNRCYLDGHMRRDCNNKKRDWIAYVISLIEDDGFNPDLVGSWKNAISRWKKANAIPEGV